MRKFILASTILCFATFLIVRVGDTFVLSAFLRLNDINHTFSFFYVEYGYSPVNNWTEGTLIFIHSVPYLLYVITGIYLPHYFRYSHYLVQLTINWICFHLILLVMAGLAAGLFLYSGPGVALTWFFVNMPVRIIGVLIMLILMLIAIRRFAWYFMNNISAFTEEYDLYKARLDIRHFVLVPFVISFIMLIPLTDRQTILNFAFSLVLGFIFVSVIFNRIPEVYIVK